ncbi:MAG: threonine--tRNA ligase [Chloroflexi bacterium]|nr:threonine--tRNA ligase [Chloroflexota bacterium]MBI3741543.1 threonine--tRNA ligase [Chloroflexota bacterium]
MENENNKLIPLRHSAAHIMAQAVLEIFPDAKLGIGPAIQDGFYYDFDLPRALSPDDLAAIEEKMRAAIAGKHKFAHSELNLAQAREKFSTQPYKLELIEAIARGELGTHGEAEAKPSESVSIYQHNGFVDLCAGPHVEDTGKLKPDAFKLTSLAGAYWRGDEKRPQLTRIYGTAWESKAELDAYLWRIEEAKKRDHRKLGKELQLFILPEEVGQGLPVWLPKGAQVRKILEDFIYENQVERGYQHVYSPHIGKKQLWITSGHWELYGDKMYAPMDIDGVEHLVKPMNCPMHMMVYKSQMRSYKDLPIRIAELATVYRREQSGELAGLLRVRMITQDDAHIFVRPDQIQDEFLRVLDQALEQFGVFGFEDFEMDVSVRDPRNKKKYLGSDEQWDNAESAITAALESRNVNFVVAEGEAKFYGPALDIMVKDALGRKWQCTTIQVDFQLPQRFNLEYIDADSAAKQPVVLHRAPFGSMERFFAILIEHFAGAFPVWIAPVQMIVIPIADRHNEYARQVEARLKKEKFRVEVDARAERMQSKIRDHQLMKVPYMLVVGDKEAEANAVAVRLRSGEDLKAMAMENFIAMARRVVDTKSLGLK